MFFPSLFVDPCAMATDGLHILNKSAAATSRRHLYFPTLGFVIAGQSFFLCWPCRLRRPLSTYSRSISWISQWPKAWVCRRVPPKASQDQRERRTGPFFIRLNDSSKRLFQDWKFTTTRRQRGLRLFTSPLSTHQLLRMPYIKHLKFSPDDDAARPLPCSAANSPKSIRS